ncbi:unnamed protein product [Effrenium voratum]|nr:unnamed protein product [Effrenium voratum]
MGEPLLPSELCRVSFGTIARRVGVEQAAKRQLLGSIEAFQGALNRTSDLSIDFGVKGGELDKKDRAPANLLSSGAFHRASAGLGDCAEKVVEDAERLAKLTPLEKPLEKRGATEFGTAEGKACPLHGAWRLLFTTAADATFTKNSSRGAARAPLPEFGETREMEDGFGSLLTDKPKRSPSGLRKRQVCNVVDAVAGTVTNCIDFTAPAVECLRVRLMAEAETPQRLGLVFSGFVRARLAKFFGIPLGKRRLTLTFPVPGPLLTRVITFFTRRAPPKPFFELLYLDDNLRVHKTGQGNVFVQEKTTLPPYL